MRSSTQCAAGARAVYPQASEVQDGRLRIGGCDARRARARVRHARCTWSPRTTCAPARGSSPRRWPRTTPTARSSSPPRRSPARRCCGSSREEGLSVDVASGGELRRWRCAPASPGERIVLHGNAKSDAELRAAAEARRADRGRQLRRARPARRASRAPRRGAGPRHAGRRRRHPRGDPHRPRRLEVRLRARRRAATRSSGCDAAPWADLRGLHIHIGSQLFDLAPWRAARARRSPRSGDFDDLRPRRRPGGRLHRRPAAALASTSTSAR